MWGRPDPTPSAGTRPSQLGKALYKVKIRGSRLLRRNVGRRLTAGAAAGVLMLGGTVVASIMGNSSVAVMFASAAGLVALTLLILSYMQTVEKLREIRADLRELSQSTSSDSWVQSLPFGNSLDASGPYYGIGTQYEYAARLRKSSSPFETYALRSRSGDARDVLARAATNLQFDYQDLHRLTKTLSLGYGTAVYAAAATWDAKSLLTLARVIASQNSQPNDMATALMFMRLAENLWGDPVFGRVDRYVYIECLHAVGEYEKIEPALRRLKIAYRDPTHASLVRANLLSSEAATTGRWEAWESELNALLGAEGYTPIRVGRNERLQPIDRLQPAASPSGIDGPLVTVIVPTFNGAARIRTALGSLLGQSWRSLEIIVVDDGSNADNLAELREIVSDYDSVRLIELGENRGAYVARNRGLEEAAGDFITVHDDDDWSHPQKIQAQMADLLRNSSQVANMSRHVRASEALHFTRINNNPSFSQPNFSSLLFRKHVIDEVGTWDDVNRGADAEFRDRLVLANGGPISVVGSAPLSFTRTHAGSLTSTEISRGYIDPSRLFYQAAYQDAHQRAVESGAPLSSLEFARPLSMMPGLRRRHLGTVDVAYVTDFRFPGGTTALTLAEIAAAARSGLRVGMVHLESPLNAPTSPITPRALELAVAENVDVLSLNDDVRASTVIVRHPTVLQFADVLSSRMEVGRVWVIANNPPILRDGTGAVYEPEKCLKNAERIFGAPATLVPETGVTRSLLEPLFADTKLSGFDWPGFVTDGSQEQGIRRPDPHRRPVLGRHSRDSALKWPDSTDEIVNLYTSNDVYDSAILGGIDSLPADAQQTLLARARVHPFGAVPVSEFLRGVDFWAYYHSSQLIESFGMAAVEAMAAGLVVFLPPYMEGTFGPGAIYAEPAEVRALVEEYWNEPGIYEQQARRAIQTVADRFSERAFLGRLDRAMSPGMSTAKQES